MISTALLTGLKVAVPVGTVASMGGAIYLASEYLPKRSSDNFVYLVVAGKATNSNATSELVTGTGNTLSKQYFCEVTLDNSTKATDRGCALFNLNSSTTDAAKHIDFKEGMFADELLTKTGASVTTSSKHILKLSKSFYDQYSKVTTADKKQIQLTHKTDSSKHFGVVTEEFKLPIKKASDIAEHSTNLFLARVHAKGTATAGQATDPLFCKLSETKTVECKIYKLTTPQEKTNEQTSTSLTNLTALTVPPTPDLTPANYLVVELTGEGVKSSELKNNLLTVHNKLASGNTIADSDKIAELYFDQVLLGKVGATPSSSTIYPLTPKTATYAVKKSNASTFADVATSSAKNYKCKFTSGSNHNYDNSCVIKTFPSSPKLHTYASMVEPSTGFTAIESNSNDKDHFLLTVDKNKLFNLNLDWTKEETIKVVAIIGDTDETKKADFTIEQEIKANQAEGKTNMALVKFKSKESISGTASPAVNKCFFEVTDTTGFACTFKKVTQPTGSSTAYEQFQFDANTASTFTTGDQFALITTGTTRPIKDFDAKTIYANLTENSATSKYTFDIIAPMGGDVGTDKIAFLLEAPRAITA